MLSTGPSRKQSVSLTESHPLKSTHISLPEFLINGPLLADCTIVLAHGAGVPMDTDFMDAFADGLADRGLRVVRFEFPLHGGVSQFRQAPTSGSSANPA
jgi:predicted alpha/beta-hydrolase family hydrolase